MIRQSGLKNGHGTQNNDEKNECGGSVGPSEIDGLRSKRGNGGFFGRLDELRQEG